MKCVIIMEKDNSFPSGTFDTALVALCATWRWQGEREKKKKDRKLGKEEERRGNPGLSENSKVLISLRI